MELLGGFMFTIIFVAFFASIYDANNHVLHIPLPMKAHKSERPWLIIHAT
jgi:hypothetical protein